jgi:hypothetical protein
MKDKNLKRIILHFGLSFCILIFAFCILRSEAEAANASLYLSPLTGTYTVDTNFSVAVKVDSGGVPINAAEASLIFNPEELRVISISKTGSIFVLWTTEPTFSNTAGTIKFGGGTPTVFTGTAGRIITITFRGRKNVTTNVNFISGMVLAADGRGTDVLANMRNGVYTLKPPVVLPPPPPVVDTEPPKPFEIEVDNKGDPTNPSPILRFEAIDLISGIDFYEIRIGDREPIKITPAELAAEPLRLPHQEPGKHSVLVKAIDRAGNFTVSLRDFVVEAIESPVIIKFPKKLQKGDFLILEGSSAPNYTVLVYVQREKDVIISREIKTDEQGNWLYIHLERVAEGIYTVWAKNRDLREAVSEPTEKIVIPVTLPPLLQIGKIAIDYLILIITLILLIVGAVAIIFYTWYRISLWREKIKKETKEASQAVSHAFKTLKEKTKEQIAKLDGKPDLSEREKKICDELKESLKNTEKFIGKEIKDIEKELH